ncbi:MAG: 2-succinyl-5-enolpyruvyl-6-hydroxy-3-cyclohexene-1-carboxylic-acid synthase [Allomuricauda sp.]|nr:MAG: 2-succinyl-5-enolpyruvyl-6-hydroxy-3-cyclohexene-1-carboxylic-acid synthase [Allomuricauda sp.]
MKCSNIPVAQTILASCKEKGVKHVVISPGSRNAPLTISFTEAPFFRCYSIVDERSAAFFALGISMQLNEPVALVCTSGSALLNYYPAVAEAFYSNIPLVVISADRPPYRIDIGDGQTIRQKNVFQNHIGYASNLKLDVNHSKHKIERYAPELLDESQQQIDVYNENEINKCLEFAVRNKQPVHLNVPFEEPLYETLEYQRVSENITSNETVAEIDQFDISDFKKKWASAKSKMVIIGVNGPNEFEKETLELLANDPSVVVFTETTSNTHHKNFFPSIDSIVFPIEKSSEGEKLSTLLRPELLLTFGGMIVSKKIKAFLRANKPQCHWHVGIHRFNNTYFSLSNHLKVNSNSFLKSLYATYLPVASDYFSFWHKTKLAYEQRRARYIKQITFSDFLVFGLGLPKIPSRYQVHLANSSTIRYTQLFDLDPTLEIFCNRGTSGIEGSTSTAIGASVHHEQPTLLITGDLSFFYDSNALWNNYIRNDFRILIVNNAGGGIFRILPGKENSEKFETYFETRHQLRARQLSELYGFDYLEAQDENSFLKQMDKFFAPSSKPIIFEVFTPAEVNDGILLDYFDFIS